MQGSVRSLGFTPKFSESPLEDFKAESDII
jgi:hypothetical protein